MSYNEDELVRMVATGAMDQMTADYYRGQGADPASSQPIDPRPEGYEMASPEALSTTGVELVDPQTVSSEYIPQQVDPETGYEMVNPLGVSSRALTKDEYDELKAASVGGPTKGDIAAAGAREKGADWIGGMERQAQGITRRGARKIEGLAGEREDSALLADYAISNARDRQWAAEERASAVYDERRTKISETRDWLTKRESHRSRVERDSENSVELASDQAKYWNYEGTEDELRRDVMLASSDKGRPEDVEAAKQRLDEAKEVDAGGGIFSDGWSTAMAAIAMGMGAFGSALSGGPNHAMQIINKAVDRNIKAQLEKKRSATSQLTTAERKFDRVLSRFDDGTQRRLVAQSMAFDELAAKAQMYAAQASTAEGKAAAEQMSMELTDQALAAKQQAVQIGVNLEMKGWDSKYKMGKLRIDMAAARAKAKAGNLRPTPGFMLEKMAAQRTVLDAVKRGREQFKKIEGATGVASGAISKATGNVWASEAALYDAAMVEIGQLVTKATQGSRPSDKDMEFTLRRVPTFYENQEQGLNKLDMMERSIIKGLAGNIVEGLADGFDYRNHYREFQQNFGMTPDEYLADGQRSSVDRSIFTPATPQEQSSVVGAAKGAYLTGAVLPMAGVTGMAAGALFGGSDD